MPSSSFVSTWPRQRLRAAPPPSRSRDVPGPALVGVGRRDSPQHLAARVDDRGLDLRPAEVDAAAQSRHAASLCPRPFWKAKEVAGEQTGLEGLVGEAALV